MDFLGLFRANKKRTVKNEAKVRGAGRIMSIPLNGMGGMRGFDDYENGYASIRAVADQFSQIKIFAIDENGAKLEETPNALRKMSVPNKDMDGVAFKDALATRSLLFDKVYILVWEMLPNGEVVPATKNVKESTVAGYTFLDGVSEELDDDGLKLYSVSVRKGRGFEIVKYGEHQVMTVYDHNPMNATAGYSATRAVKRWAEVQDQVADYQNGFFENGAVPAGQMSIIAENAEEFADEVAKARANFGGAKGNNGVLYTHRPVDGISGELGAKKYEWESFATNNKDLAMKDLLDHAQEKIDGVFRVSGMQRAIVDSPNYATAQVDDRNFIEKTVRPFALKRWLRIQHELNRICGGLGYGISFEIETPFIAEEEKAKAETNRVIFETLNNITEAGYTLESAIEALKLPNNWKLLAKGESVETEIVNEKAEIVEQGENEERPQPQMKIKRVESRKDEKSDMSHNIEKHHHHGFKAKIDDTSEIEALVNETIETMVKSQSEKANDEDLERWTEIMVGILTGYVLSGGREAIEKIRNEKTLMKEIESVEDFEISDDFSVKINERAKTLMKDFTNETGREIQKIMVEVDDEVERLALLKELPVNDRYRVERLAKNEAYKNKSMGEIEAMRDVQKRNGLTITKTWKTTNPNACSFCKALAGTTVNVADSYITKGETIVDDALETFEVDYETVETAILHPNCTCEEVFRIHKPEDMVKERNDRELAEILGVVFNERKGKNPKGIYSAENGRYLGEKLGDGVISLKVKGESVETVAKIR